MINTCFGNSMFDKSLQAEVMAYTEGNKKHPRFTEKDRQNHIKKAIDNKAKRQNFKKKE